MTRVREKRPADVETVRRWARVLDSQFRIPGTRFRFGLDPIIGLVPGIGDLVGPVFAVVVVAHAWKMRVPKIVIARMIVNAGVDAVLGLIPLLGDAVDVFWKANQANVRLLEQHAFERRTVSRGDYVFVFGAVLAALAIMAIPLIAVVWALSRLGVLPPH
jgi:hypothetical protein